MFSERVFVDCWRGTGCHGTTFTAALRSAETQIPACPSYRNAASGVDLASLPRRYYTARDIQHSMNGGQLRSSVGSLGFVMGRGFYDERSDANRIARKRTGHFHVLACELRCIGLRL
jgi:hypothetical protein